MYKVLEFVKCKQSVLKVLVYLDQRIISVVSVSGTEKFNEYNLLFLFRKLLLMNPTVITSLINFGVFVWAVLIAELFGF